MGDQSSWNFSPKKKLAFFPGGNDFFLLEVDIVRKHSMYDPFFSQGTSKLTRIA